MPREVFISYASADAATAGRICTALEAAGISCWMAPRDVQAGTDYPAAIVDAVASSTVMVVLLTGTAVSSRHVLSEVGHAFNNRKRIVPVRFSAVPLSKELDYFLSMAQWLDAQDGCTDENLKRIQEAVQAAIRGEVLPEKAAQGRAGIRVKRMALIAVLPVAAVAVAYWNWPRPSRPAPEPKREIAGEMPLAVSPSPPGPKTRINAVDGQEYGWIPRGSFIMGCSPSDSQCAEDEKPAHPVEIVKGFWLARVETTVAAYRKFAVKHGEQSPAGDGNLPAVEVTWARAKQYCADVGGRLPTEAEWEYAARGGKAEAWYGPLPAIAWYAENSGDTRHPVGTKQPNLYGLYDMLGNVSEWVLDRYYNRYDLTSPATGEGVEQPLASNASAVARGGFFGGNAATVRVSHRAEYPTDAAELILGFRCASDAP